MWFTWLDSKHQRQVEFRQILDLENTHMYEDHGEPLPLKAKHHVGNGKPKGIFAGTLTMSPNDPYNEKDMISAIIKLMKQKSCPVKRYAWYLEYTNAGTPHIHFIYETQSGGRITAQTFGRCWSLWDENIECGRGHKGGYHSFVHNEDAYLEYIAKCNNVNSVNKWTK